MMAAFPYALGYLLPPLVVWCARAGGAWRWVPVALVFAGLPLVDAVSGQARGPQVSALERNPWFRAVTWLWVPVQLGLLGWSLVQASDPTRGGVEIVGLALSVGVCTGTVGITFAHELIHRASAWERALGELLLTAVSYPHFAIEHVLGHHRTVGTPVDPATARTGESFYRFLPRTVAGGLRSAWMLESQRVRRRRGAAWHPSNRMLRYLTVQLLLYGGVATLLGGPAAWFLAGQATFAIAQLEVINYIEHYGLERRELRPGVYERVEAWHSWDSYHRVSNWLLINLAHHADHHCLASRRFPALSVREAAPALPAGYGAMFLLALAPPLWRRVMDPRIPERR
jgi:alkane 1-monooxygenase